jgi:hypothetical protein
VFGLLQKNTPKTFSGACGGDLIKLAEQKGKKMAMKSEAK